MFMQEQILLQEKLAVSSDTRKQEMKEREVLMEQGNTLSAPPDFEGDSILLRQAQAKEHEASIMREMQEAQGDKELDQIEKGLQEEDPAQAQPEQQKIAQAA